MQTTSPRNRGFDRRTTVLGGALFLLLVTGVAAGRTAAAQEAPPREPGEAPPGPPPAEPAPSGPAKPSDDVAALPERIGDLHARVVRRPPPPDLNAEDPARARAAAAKAAKAWEEDVRALAAAGDRYVAAAAAPDARTLFRAGYGKSVLAGRQSRKEGLETRAVAAAWLAKALGLAKPDDDFRGDAEHALGHVQLFLAAEGRATWDEAASHLREGALRLRAAGRLDDSGRAAFLGLESVLRNGTPEAARAFADAVGAASADFGISTPSLRLLAQRAATSVGQKLPDLPDLVDTEGRAIRWSEFRGRPLLLHFFQAARPTGHLSQERDVEVTLRPLHDELSPKGLRLLGVSMDLALTKEQVARIAANWDEWGLKDRVQDGSLDGVRAWAGDEGMTWPWVWDGKWGENPISKALGGCGRNTQHAVLVDSAGIIRWRGDSPFQGLPEAARKLCEEKR